MTSSLPLQLQLWSHLSARMHLTMAAQIVAVIGLGLAIDKSWGWTGQHLVTLWTIAVFSWLFWLGRRDERAVLVLCMFIAGVGEGVLSLLWGLYDYQFANVPLFVPPGHALLMTLGLLAARHLSSRQAWSVVALGAAWGGFALWRGIDQFGLTLFVLFVLCMLVSRARALYAAMFVLALVLVKVCSRCYGGSTIINLPTCHCLCRRDTPCS